VNLVPLFYRSTRNFSTHTQPRVVVLVGPTGIGKSKIAVNLAASINGELISADSVKVYKGLDIGSNKPSIVNYSSTKNIPLHLIDILEPGEYFSKGDYSKLSRSTAADIIKRGKVPIIFGGCGFYINGFLTGGGDAPKRDPKISENIKKTLQADGNWEKSLSRLMEVDPSAASNIPRNQYIRLIRALEVYKVTGKPFSSFGVTDPLPYDIRSFFLNCNSRKDAYRKIDFRCEMMIKEGLLDEVFHLLQNKMMKSPLINAIGYKHSIDFILKNNHDLLEFSNFLKTFQADSRDYARRQMSWFANQSTVPLVWCDVSNPNIGNEIRELSLANRSVYESRVEKGKGLPRTTYEERRLMKHYISNLKIYNLKSLTGTVMCMELLEKFNQMVRKNSESINAII